MDKLSKCNDLVFLAAASSSLLQFMAISPCCVNMPRKYIFLVLITCGCIYLYISDHGELDKCNIQYLLLSCLRYLLCQSIHYSGCLLNPGRYHDDVLTRVWQRSSVWFPKHTDGTSVQNFFTWLLTFTHK